jgi:hypothetical protein
MDSPTKRAQLVSLLQTEPYLTLEVPTDSFFLQSRKQMGVGFHGSVQTIIHKRCWKHILLFIYIEPSVKQLYVALDLRRYPHYHTTRTCFEEVKAAIIKLDGNNNRMVILRSDSNHFHPNVTVINQFSEKLSSFFKAVSLEEVNRLVNKRIHKDARGNLYINVGYSGNENKGRKQDSFGSELPRLCNVHPELNPDEKLLMVDKCLLAMSSITYLGRDS